jgi:glycosyltransferase involved in cell wall biosynthesis
LISVVIPAYNAGRFLDTTLTSLQEQTESRWECVVVDDGSTDDTAEVARRFAGSDPRISTISIANGGPSAARNAGFRVTSAPHVTFMDADDVYLTHALHDLLSRLDSSPEAVGAHGLAEFIDENGSVVDPGSYPSTGRMRLGRIGRRLEIWPLEWPTTFDVLVNGNVMFPPGLMLARRSAYQVVGPFDEQFKGPEDWDMLIRLSRQGPLEFVDDVILHYRRHGSNLGASPSVARQAWLVRCKAFHSSENSPAQKRAARAGWRAYQRSLMEQAVVEVADVAPKQRPRALLCRLPRLVVLTGRFARGWPTPRLKSGATRW